MAAKRIPEDFIQQLLDRIDIVDVVERYVPLKKAGQNYVACCPFHNEKSPSFTVSPTKQFYHCFGCGAHGTAISFLMEHSGMGFIDAVNDLAQGAGMQVPVSEPGPQDIKAAQQRQVSESLGLPEVMQQACKFYREQLKQSPTAIAYLKKRGLSGEIAAKFGLGYAPAGWQGLQAIVDDYASNAALLEGGLVIDNDSGRRYDRFRDRIMFPIVSQRGMIIGFGGRVLDGGEPKYLNSPETPLFEKGRELYGLFQARQAIRDAGKVIVVEGYMDVVALAQYGISYAVATLGTATTPFHVQKLMRQTERVVFCFDGDKAGRKAAWRALENALPQLQDGKQLEFLFLPQDEDPDSYVRKHGTEAFEILIEREGLPLTAFLVKELSTHVDLQTEEGRAKLLTIAKPLVMQIVAPALSLMLRKRLAELTGVDPSELDELYGIRSGSTSGYRSRESGSQDKYGKRGPRTASRPRPASPSPARQPLSLARQIMHWILLQPEIAANIVLPILPNQDAEQAALAAVVGRLQHGTEVKRTAQVLELFRDSPHEGVIRSAARQAIEREGQFDDEAARREVDGLVGKLFESSRRAQFDLLQKKLTQGSLSPDELVLYQELLGPKK